MTVDFRPELAVAAGLPVTVAAVEAHEATLWRRCFEEVNRLSEAKRMPARAVAASVGSASAFAIEGLNSRDLNRVLGLGLGESSTPDDVAGIVAVFRQWGVTRYQIEVADSVLPSVEEPLERAGLVRHPDPIWVSVRPLDELPELEPGSCVQILDAGHASQVAALQRQAWGFWEPSEPLDLWFSATLARPGFSHFGVGVDGRLSTMGSLYVDGELGWAGFDATLPRVRNIGLRGALSATRIRRAAELGCRLLHAETYRPPTECRGWHISHVKSRWVPEED